MGALKATFPGKCFRIGLNSSASEDVKIRFRINERLYWRQVNAQYLVVQKYKEKLIPMFLTKTYSCIAVLYKPGSLLFQGG